MRHDELLAEIDNVSIAFSNGFGSAKKLFNSVKALRKVVELHKPFDDDPDECGHCGDGYPCITVQVIEKELA